MYWDKADDIYECVCMIIYIYMCVCKNFSLAQVPNFTLPWCYSSITPTTSAFDPSLPALSHLSFPSLLSLSLSLCLSLCLSLSTSSAPLPLTLSQKGGI